MDVTVAWAICPATHLAQPMRDRWQASAKPVDILDTAYATEKLIREAELLPSTLWQKYRHYSFHPTTLLPNHPSTIE